MSKLTYHQIDVVRQDLPCPLDIWHQRLTAEFALRSHLERDTGDFCCENSQLRHLPVSCNPWRWMLCGQLETYHVVDRDLQVQDLSLHIGIDSLCQITPRYGLGLQCQLTPG